MSSNLMLSGPTAASSQCTRHAFSDGACRQEGCRDCPGAAERADQARATRAAARRRTDDTLLLFAIAAALVAFCVLGWHGLSREEVAFLLARV